jgi:hypothetical protein
MREKLREQKTLREKIDAEGQLICNAYQSCPEFITYNEWALYVLDFSDSILSLMLKEVEGARLTVIEMDLIWDKWMKTPHVTGINSMDKLMDLVANAQHKAVKKILGKV